MRPTAQDVFTWAAARTGLVTPLGRWVAVAGLVSTFTGLRLGWSELIGLGLSLLAVLLVALPWTLGRGPDHVSLVVDPARVTVGDRALARVVSVGRTGRRTRGLRIEVPIAGANVTTMTRAVDLPAVRAGSTVHREIVLPTDRRAVLEVGPVCAVRADPLGLTRRTVATGASTRLVVRPGTVRVPATGSGLLRDLEGLSTEHISPSDLSFQSLREYVPGDDRRNVHWRTSARVGRLMVRQFVDTRRAQLTLVLALDPADYGDQEDVELAISVIASIILRAFADQAAVRVLAGGRWLPTIAPETVLDALAGLVVGPHGAGPSTAALVQSLGVTTDGDVVVVTGARAHLSGVAAAAVRMPAAAVTGIRIAPSRSGRTAGLRVLEVQHLADLPRTLGLLADAAR